MNNLTNIFAYHDYRHYLKETFAAIKEVKPQVSHRFIAARLGYKSSGAISLILSGRKNVSLEKACSIAGFLHLEPMECAYFLEMVSQTQKQTPVLSIAPILSFNAPTLSY